MYFVVCQWGTGWKHVKGPFDSFEQAEKVAFFHSQIRGTHNKPIAFVCHVVDTKEREEK